MTYNRILIIGDLILDSYHIGSVNRISPEAPVPVFDEEKIEYSIGGAGNVAANIRSILPIRVDLLVLRSRDFLLHEMLETAKINVFSASNEVETITKHRFIDKRNKQQVGLRWDYTPEKKWTLDQNAFRIIDKYKYDAIIFSDYDKGALDNEYFIKSILDKAVKDDSWTFLDSKSKNLKKFEGVEIFKPNNKEYEIYLKNKTFDFEYVVRTESENGMTLYDDVHQEMLHIPSRIKDVVSTVGAGDSAMAGLVWGLMNKLKIHKAVEVSNYLAGKACLHPGTYVLTQDDIISCMKDLNIEFI